MSVKKKDYPRSYRNFLAFDGLKTYSVCIDESDLFIRSDKLKASLAFKTLFRCRQDILDYIRDNPHFKTSLAPIVPDTLPEKEIVRSMIRAGMHASVGPMASVAGAVSECVGSRLSDSCNEVIIENGGDIFLSVKKERTIGTFAGESAFSNKTFFEVDESVSPLGICTSSGTIGHSLSFGRADAVTVVSRSCSLADAAATSICNEVKSADDIDFALEKAKKIPGVAGTVILFGDSIGVWGELKMRKRAQDEGITFKVTSNEKMKI